MIDPGPGRLMGSRNFTSEKAVGVSKSLENFRVRRGCWSAMGRRFDCVERLCESALKRLSAGGEGIG